MLQNSHAQGAIEVFGGYLSLHVLVHGFFPFPVPPIAIKLLNITTLKFYLLPLISYRFRRINQSCWNNIQRKLNML